MSETYVSAGYGPNKYISAGSANQDSQVIKDSQGVLGMISVYNVATSARFLKLYDKATAPTAADTPVQTYAIPAAAASSAAGTNVPIPPGPNAAHAGLGFEHGISFRITTGIADDDDGAAGADEVVVNYAVG